MNKQKIYKLICESHSVPFIITDESLFVIAANYHAEKYFNIKLINQSLKTILSVESCDFIKDEVTSLVSSSEAIRSSSVKLKLLNGEELNAKIDFQNFAIEEDQVISLKINSQQIEMGSNDLSEMEIQPADLKSLNLNEDLIEVLEKSIELFPLTFIGKETIHKMADRLDEFFWIKDEKGILLLVNDTFANEFGLKPYQMEGKPLLNFIPGFLSNFFESIEQYLKDSLSALFIRGFPLKSFSLKSDKDLIIIPLVDDNKNVAAIAGFSRKKEINAEVKTPDILTGQMTSIFNKLPYPVALLNSSGYFKQSNKEFCKLFARKFNDLTDLKYSEVFSLPLSDTLKRFIDSNSDGIIIEVDNRLEIVREAPDFKLSAGKILDENKKIRGILLSLQKTEFIDDLQQLIKSKGRMFEVLIKKNPEPIFVYDRENLKFLEVNDAALNLYGYSYDEFIQMDLTDLYSPEDIQTLLDSSGSESDEGVFGKPLRHRKKDGTSVVVRLSKIGFNFNDKEAVFNIIKDVTDEVDTKQKTQHYQLAFENTSDLIFVTDPSGIIISVNQSAVDKLNLPKEEIENSSLATYGFDEDRVTINNSIFLSEQKDETNFKVQLKDASGSPFDVDLFVFPQIDVNGEVESYTILAKLIETSSEPGKVEIKEVVKKVFVEKPTEPAKKEPALDPNFLHGVFHEILTPMNVILGFTQELTESVESLNAEQKEAVDIINQNRVTLLGTMNSIIEFTDITLKDTETEYSDVPITNLIEQLDNSMREITGKKDVEFAFGKISSSLKFKTDRKKLDALLHNLIKIVSKVTDTKKIYFSAQPVEENDFLISISDKYGSISEKLLNIFDQLFINSADPKEFGVSKLTTQISKSLLTTLNGKYVSFTDNNGRKENGFRFPLDLEESSTYTQELEKEADDEFISEIQESEFTNTTTEQELSFDDQTNIEIEDELRKTEVANEKVIDESINEEPEIEEHIIEDQVSEDTSLIEEDTFDEPVSEELTIEEPEKTSAFEEKPEEIESEFEEKISEEELYHSEPEEDLSIEEEPVTHFDKGSGLDLSGLTCLYIEDQVDSQILFKVQMKGLKEIRFCASFEEALPVLETQRFDFIVMDINLQGEYNGLDALKIIHRMSGFEHVPIIAVTAYVLPGDKEKFIATGFNDFISKPIFREKMVESLEKIFVHK